MTLCLPVKGRLVAGTLNLILRAMRFRVVFKEHVKISILLYLSWHECVCVSDKCSRCSFICANILNKHDVESVMRLGVFPYVYL